MRSSEERVNELHRRMASYRRTKARRSLWLGTAAVAACLAVVILFALDVSRRAFELSDGNVGGITASIFAEHGALGFVTVALAAFCLGALATVLCFRLKRNGENGENGESGETRDDRRP